MESSIHDQRFPVYEEKYSEPSLTRVTSVLMITRYKVLLQVSQKCTHILQNTIQRIMPQPTNLEIIQNLYLANDHSDLEAFYRDLSPTIVWKESDGFPAPGVFRSRADIQRHVFNVLRHEWDNFHFSLEHLVDGNERIVAVGTYRGTHRKTGRSFEARASHLWHILNGKIESFEQFADTHTMQTAALSPVDSVSVA